MANSNTEHSKKLRAKTAAEHLKRKLADGSLRQYGIKLPKEDADLFDRIVEELGVSRPQAIKALCEFYLAHR